MAATAAFAWLAGETPAAAAFGSWFVLPLAAGVVIGLVVGKRGNGATARSDIARLALFWLLLPALVAPPVRQLVPEIGWSGAYFEMVSGFTTTGATVIDALDSRPRALLLWRSLTQWIGGFGTLVAIFLVLAPRRLGTFGPDVPTLVQLGTRQAGGRLAQATRRIGPFYLGATLAVFGVLVQAGLVPFDALNLAMTALSTGGFSTHDGGLAAFANPWAEAGVAFGMLLGAAGFGLMLVYRAGGWRRLVADSELRLLVLIVALAVLIPYLRLAYGAWSFGGAMDARQAGAVFWAETFRALSFLTTSGFTSAYADAASGWSGLQTPVVVPLGLAAVGGAAVSTTGGVRLRNIATLISHSLEQARRVGVPPNVLTASSIEGHALEVRRAWLAAMMYAISASAGMLLLSYAGLDFEAAMGAAISSMSNAGPVFTLMEGDNRAWARIPPETQMICCVLMMLGRTGLIAIVAALRAE